MDASRPLLALLYWVMYRGRSVKGSNLFGRVTASFDLVDLALVQGGGQSGGQPFLNASRPLSTSFRWLWHRERGQSSGQTFLDASRPLVTLLYRF